MAEKKTRVKKGKAQAWQKSSCPKAEKEPVAEVITDPALLAKERRRTLYDFYDSVQRGSESFSQEELDIAIESLKLAKLDIHERERRKIQEMEAEQLKKAMERKERLRIAAEQRAAARAEAAHRQHVEEVTAMDLPDDFENAFKDDSRANITCESVSDALLLCIDALGMVDIEFISAITGQEMKTVIEKLKGSIFQNPLHYEEVFYKGWETADEYLSGNLLHKYEIALEANEKYLGYFDDNVKAIEALLEPGISTNDIYITIGSPWVPTDILDEFILYMVDVERDIDGQFPSSAEPLLDPEFAVKRDDYTGIWSIPKKMRFSHANFHGKYEEYSYHIWGTGRVGMLTLMENILNMKTPAVYDYKGEGENKVKIFNSEETVKLIEKQEKMIAAFKEWVWKDEERKRRLVGAYNRRYGNIRKRRFDGSFFEFPGMSPDVELRPHQRDAVARIIFSDNTLLAHDVGAGKTFTMIAAGMELKRLGKSDKNLYVVPNNIIAQWRRMFLQVYPKANILVVDRRNFTIKKRDETLRHIMNDDYDAILMTYSCFDMLSLSKKYYMEFYEKKLEELNRAKENFASKRQIDAKRASVMKLLQKLQEEMVENVCDIPFDELGIQTLFVDEAHNYKNVSVPSSMSHVRGISSNGSRKCDGMMDKVHCVQRMNHGGRVIMATGTPITNSITDLFVLQKYLQDGELEFLAIQNFDAWAAMFAKKVTEFEIDVDTNSYRLATRFSRFCNVPELTAILSSISDFYRIDASMGLPDFEGYTDTLSPGNEDFREFLRDISRRADDVRKQRVNRKEDNLLKITGDGRRAALDMRLIDMAYGLDVESKVYRCAENIIKVYEETRDTKRIQMVFCDVSTPKPTFNMYDELKSILVAMGIPEHEIAYIHEADSEDKKNLLFHDLRKGLVSVVIGSTFKMGLGVNVQERLCALHHLDVPWRPADMVQREGRILRQGNRCGKVDIYRYITKGSFDAYSWQLLEKKQRFISQILSGTACDREGDDVDQAVLNYAEVKALAVGNPLIKKRVELNNEIDRLRILQRGRVLEVEKMERELEALPGMIERQREHIANTEEDILFYAENGNNYEEMEYKEQYAIRETIFNAVKENINLPFDVSVLTYQGFDVVVPARMRPREVTARDGAPAHEAIPYVYVKRKGTYFMEVESISGVTKRLNNLLDNLEEHRRMLEDELEALLKKQSTLKTALTQGGVSYAEDIERLMHEVEEIEKELELVA